MTRKAFFCYEQAFDERWVPVVYYDELPKPMSKENKPIFAAVFDISNTIVEDGETSYGFETLQRLFPNPLLKNKSTHAIESVKEKQMPRPVSGFLSATGQFFETEEEANLYDARYNLQEVATTAVAKQPEMFVGMDDESIVESLFKFINQHEGLIYDYIIARRSVSQATDERIRSTTENNSDDDQRVRDEINAELDKLSVSKADITKS